MKLVGVAMVKNEQDIIETFIRYNLQYLDSLFIIDHDSYDDTGYILSQIRQEGLPVNVYSEKRLEFLQEARTTELIRKVFQLSNPDFIFCLDADEFLVVQSRKILEEKLMKLPNNTFGLVPWKTYVVRKVNNKSSRVNVLKRITHRRDNEVPQYYKAVVPAFFTKEPSYTVSKGNHNVKSSKGKCSHKELSGISLAHFPVRSRDQITAKSLTTWLASLMSNPDFLSTKQSWHTYEIYKKILEQGGLTDKEVIEISKRYACKGDQPIRLIKEPLIANFNLRYTRQRSITPLQLILRLFERYIAQ